MEEPNPYEPPATPAEVKAPLERISRYSKTWTILVYAMLSVLAAGYAFIVISLASKGIVSLYFEGDDYIKYCYLLGLLPGIRIFSYYFRLIFIEYNRPEQSTSENCAEPITKQ